jgi:hypothetical protein
MKTLFLWLIRGGVVLVLIPPCIKPTRPFKNERAFGDSALGVFRAFRARGWGVRVLLVFLYGLGALRVLTLKDINRHRSFLFKRLALGGAFISSLFSSLSFRKKYASV